MIKELRKCKCLRYIFYVRDTLMSKFGLFKLKRYVKNKLFLLRIQKEDAAKKLEIEKLIYLLETNTIENKIDNDDFVFSLTSYGKRVEYALPYALYSIITQSIKPKKIVVYLDNDNWSDDRLPNILQQLRRVGVDFRYCNDIRSYKKLIPALKDFPNNPIVTLDDDFYYNPQYHSWMRSAYDNSDKKTVLGQWGCIPKIINGNYAPYSTWVDCKDMKDGDEISFFGCCCCYPPYIFDDEILNEKIFMSLCPTADDIWFWIMEKRLKIERKFITPFGYGYNIPINRIEEYDLSQTGTLMYTNVTLGNNDVQLKLLLEYYNILPENENL